MANHQLIKASVYAAITAATVGITATWPVQAQSSSGSMTSTGSSRPALDDKDVKFVNKAAIADMYEIESSKLALEKSQNPQVKTFAQQMTTDHGKTSAELKSLATQKGVQVPTALDDEHQSMLDKLRKQSTAKDFDAEYGDQMSKSHSEAVSLYKTASSDAKDPAIKQFASKTLPALEHHKAMAKQLDDAT